MPGYVLHVLNAADTWRNNNVIIASKRRRNVVFTSQRRFDVIMTLLLRCVSSAHLKTCLLRCWRIFKMAPAFAHLPVQSPCGFWVSFLGWAILCVVEYSWIVYYVLSRYSLVDVLVVSSRFYRSIFFLLFAGTSDCGRSRSRSSLDVWLGLGAVTDDTIYGMCMLMKDTHTDVILHWFPYVQAIGAH